jgi:hypothetical protein
LYSKNKRKIKSCYEYKERVDLFLFKKKERKKKIGNKQGNSKLKKEKKDVLERKNRIKMLIDKHV